MKLILTVDEIEDLAKFAGFTLADKQSSFGEDEGDTEIAIESCPEKGVKNDDGSILHTKHIAYFEEYPEEGVYPLGKQTNNVSGEGR